MRHAPFAIGTAARDRWLQLMTRALDESSLPQDVHSTLKTFFDSTATFLINRPE
jgi:hemoglobin